MRKLLVRLVALFITLSMSTVLSSFSTADPLPRELKVDYANFNAISLVLKKFGWLEKEFQRDNLPVRWVFSEGSNQGLENLATGGVDIASTSAVASVLGKAKGRPIKAVYIFSHLEWAAFLVTQDSSVKTLLDLKGKKIAVTPGTDSYLFFLRALHDARIRQSEVMMAPKPPQEGLEALQKKSVAAWVGSNYYCSKSQLESGSREIYTKSELLGSGYLTVTESFAAKYPDVVARVIKVYDSARKWSIRHPDDLVTIYADAGNVSLPVAKLIVSRIDFSRAIPDTQDIRNLKQTVPVLIAENLLKKSAKLGSLVEELIDNSYAASLINKPLLN
ncbi:aliphatic sulfonate ABC transporter substrate-binding protein [Chlorobium sp. BLA1]|uniref:aliphatic sulfonate ABC transporter substrate-binding protein n=1 Tax=Candidatus Chlorobium masyuteum TaxID=2716876 RepID=UPI001421B918|nr:aliphatic sulfonate ABC transporter substrate-binding protein [Candidatus Chlorobium masyuteum]NHQ59034.1 aliphatic sulfonate ABC transporter substrate-binding protein [Candidatus Chlorobium masyuteum]